MVTRWPVPVSEWGVSDWLGALLAAVLLLAATGLAAWRRSKL